MIKKTIEDLERENLAAYNSILKVGEFIKSTGQEVMDLKQWAMRLTDCILDMNNAMIMLGESLKIMNGKIDELKIKE